MYEIYSKLTIKTPQQPQYIVNFEHILHIIFVFSLSTLNESMPAGVNKYCNLINCEDFLVQSCWKRKIMNVIIYRHHAENQRKNYYQEGKNCFH